MTAIDLISDLRISLDPTPRNPELKAIADFRFGPLRISGIRVVRMADGRDVVRWPETPRRVPCASPRCTKSVGIIHGYCQWCGAQQPRRRPDRDPNTGAPKVYRSLANPIGRPERVALDNLVLGAYLEALQGRAGGATASAPALFVPRVVA